MVSAAERYQELTVPSLVKAASVALAPRSEFLALLLRRATTGWWTFPTIFALIICLVLQNLWVHLGIPAVASLYPYGAAGLVLLFGLFLLDPLTIAYLVLLRKAILKGLGQFPPPFDLALAGVEPMDIFRALRFPLMLLLSAELVINSTIDHAYASVPAPGISEERWITPAVSFLLMATTIPPVATVILLAASASRVLVVQFSIACAGLVPLLTIIACADLWSYDWPYQQNWGYKAAAIPVMIVLGQLYGWGGRLIFRRLFFQDMAK